MTNIYDTSSNPTVPFSIPFAIRKPLTIAIDVSPEIETKATSNNFWDLLESEGIVLKGEDASRFREMLFDLEAIEERDAFIATELNDKKEKEKKYEEIIY